MLGFLILLTNLELNTLLLYSISLGLTSSKTPFLSNLSLARHEQVIVHFKYIDCGGCRLIGRDLGDILTFIRLFRPKL